MRCICRWEREQMQGDAVTCTSQRVRCCQSDFVLLASSWGSVGEDFGNFIKQICTCALPWGAGDPPCRWFVSIGGNILKRQKGSFWEATPGCLGRVGGFRQDLGGDFSASKAKNVFNISATADILELSKYLHMLWNWQGLWSSKMRLKKNYMLWKVWCASG